MQLTTVEVPVPWAGSELDAHPTWQWQIAPSQVEELDCALDGWRAVAHEDLSPSLDDLPTLGPLMAEIGAELATGSGVAKLSGFPVERYSSADLTTVFLGLSVYLGPLAPQNGRRGWVREIRDRSAEGGQRVDSAGALGWHTDRTDIVGLLCVCEPATGGTSRIASATAIHNYLLTHHRSDLEVLYCDFERFSPGDEVGQTHGVYQLPIFRRDHGRFSTHYSRTYIEQAAARAGASGLSSDQVNAMDVLIRAAEQLGYEMPLRTGEIQYLNNHAILHGRGAFEDDRTRGKVRRLLRVWLSTPDGHAWSA